MVGFNRRFSPAAVKVRDFFAEVRDPLTVSVRFNAGPIPQGPLDSRRQNWRRKDHWRGLPWNRFGNFSDRQSTRSSLCGIHRRFVSPEITDDQCFITLRHANGSISQIAYLAGGDKAFPKERVEVFGGGRVAVIDDFRELTFCAGGKIKHHKNRTQDKGHSAEIDRFALSLTKGGSVPIQWNELRSVSIAAILAVRSIREGVPFRRAMTFDSLLRRLRTSRHLRLSQVAWRLRYLLERKLPVRSSFLSRPAHRAALLRSDFPSIPVVR